MPRVWRASSVVEGEFSQLLIRVDPYSEEFARDVASEIKDRLSKENVGVGTIIYQAPEKHWGRPIMEGINLVLQILAVVSLGASAVLILNTLMALVTEQTHQIGMIKAIGGSTGTIIKLYLVGVLTYGLLALLISLPLGAFVAFTATRWLLNLFNIDYEIFQYSARGLYVSNDRRRGRTHVGRTLASPQRRVDDRTGSNCQLWLGQWKVWLEPAGSVG